MHQTSNLESKGDLVILARSGRVLGHTQEQRPARPVVPPTLNAVEVGREVAAILMRYGSEPRLPPQTATPAPLPAVPPALSPQAKLAKARADFAADEQARLTAALAKTPTAPGSYW
jgi:hypothetical protein